MKEEKALELVRNEISNFLDNQISFDMKKDFAVYKESIDIFSGEGKFQEAKEVYDNLSKEYSSLETKDPIVRKESYDIVKDIFENFSSVLKKSGIKVVEKKKEEREKEEKLNKEIKPEIKVEVNVKPEIIVNKEKESITKEKLVDIAKTTEESLTPKERREVKIIKETVEKEKLKEVVSPDTVSFLVDSGMNYLKDRSLRKSAYVYVKIYELYPKLKESEKKNLRPKILGLFNNIKEKTFFTALTNLTGFLNTIEQSLKQSKKLVNKGMIVEASEEIDIVKSLHDQIPDRFSKEKEKYFDEIMSLYNNIQHEVNLLKKAKLIKNSS